MTHYTVLGAGGFIGSHMAQYLRDRELECFAPARDDASIFAKDLGRIIYCIGLTADYRERPYDTVDAHVGVLNRLLQAGNFEKLVYLSSTRLYDGQTGEISREDNSLLLNPAHPRHLYDLSKALGENLCLTASEGRASVGRLSGVYDDSPDSTGFLSGIIHRLKQEKSFTIDSATGITRDYVHLNDVLNALKNMADDSKSQIVNVASGENVSNQDILDVLNAEGYQITCQRQSERETRPVCDITRLKGLGVDPVSVTTFLRNKLTAEK